VWVRPRVQLPGFNARQIQIGDLVLREIRHAAEIPAGCGVDYLSLDRPGDDPSPVASPAQIRWHPDRRRPPPAGLYVPR